MRLNKFEDDEFSLGNPTWTLANRGDLYKDPKDRISYFAIDAKITTYKRIVEEDGCDYIILIRSNRYPERSYT